MNHTKLFWSLCTITLCLQVSLGDEDPLSFLKQYYEEHEANKESKIPTVDNFDKSYDFVIIGGGSGGSVMASRLSEVPEWNVLLLEAGEQANFITDIPILTGIAVGSDFDWKYNTEKQSNASLSSGGIINWPRGKTLGGTSAINGNVYTRGNKINLNEWAASGNPGWSYDDVLKYFKKSENLRISSLFNSTYRSRTGYLSVENPGYETPLAPLFRIAGKDLGYEDNPDYNGEKQIGFCKIQATFRHGRKCSAAKAFLKPASSRENLFIATSAFVTKILINRMTTRAAVVEFKKNGTTYSVRAKREVILSAGVINSPQILMLSGIGPRKYLWDNRIHVVKDLRVGYNLQDHLGIRIRFDMNTSGVTIKQEVLESQSDVTHYFKRGLGPLTVPRGSEGIAFVRSELPGRSKAPDIELVMIDTEIMSGNLAKYMKKMENDYFYIMAIMLNPKSTGYVRLRNKDPEVHPLIQPNYLTDKHDMKVLLAGAKLAVKVARTKAFAKYNTTLNPTPYPGCEDLVFESDEYWECAIRQVASTLHHQVGTCKMGPASDPDAVVDPRLRVHGIRGLRVVDASIMPTIPGAHTNAVVYMIAEKAADMVKEDLLPFGHPQRPKSRAKA